MRLTTYPVVCEKCGQVRVATIQHGACLICELCAELARQPQGETVRLFTPAPNQLDGQLSF